MGVFGPESPVDRFRGSVAVFLPCGHFTDRSFPIKDPAVKALVGNTLDSLLWCTQHFAWNAPGTSAAIVAEPLSGAVAHMPGRIVASHCCGRHTQPGSQRNGLGLQSKQNHSHAVRILICPKPVNKTVHWDQKDVGFRAESCKVLIFDPERASLPDLVSTNSPREKVTHPHASRGFRVLN